MAKNINHERINRRPSRYEVLRHPEKRWGTTRELRSGIIPPPNATLTWDPVQNKMVWK